MKFRNIFWGIILILFGVLFTLENLNVIDFDWYNMWRLWPVVIILWGISILPVKDIFKVGFVLLVLAGSVYYMVNDNVKWRYVHDYGIETTSSAINQEFQVPYEDSITTANLYMEMALGSLKIRDTTDQLVDFSKSGSLIEYRYSFLKNDNDADIRIMMADEFRYKRKKNNNHLQLKLNPIPVWNLDIEAGMSEVNFDLSEYRVESLTVEGGMAGFTLKLGNLYPQTKVDIESGFSAFTLRIPESSGCELKINKVLSGHSFSGFEKVADGLYRTTNFDESTEKVLMEFDAAFSDFKVIRY